MNTVSTVWRSFRFMSAIWNSYSKSETARSPRTMQSACSRSTRSMVRPSNDVIRMRSIPAVHSSISSRRSFTVNSGSLDGVATTATISSSKTRRLRSMRSRCPLCIGSNIPGYTARLPTRTSVRGFVWPTGRASLRRGAKECQGGLAELPRPGRAQHADGVGRRRLARVLQHDDGARPERRASAEGGEGRFRSGRVVRWIEERDGEARAAPHQRVEAARGVGAHDARPIAEAEALDVLAERAEGECVLLDEHRRRRATRQ